MKARESVMPFHLALALALVATACGGNDRAEPLDQLAARIEAEGRPARSPAHRYRLVTIHDRPDSSLRAFRELGGFTWREAERAAAGMTYQDWFPHLVTITSEEENTRVGRLLRLDQECWIALLQAHEMGVAQGPAVGWGWYGDNPWQGEASWRPLEVSLFWPNEPNDHDGIEDWDEEVGSISKHYDEHNEIRTLWRDRPGGWISSPRDLRLSCFIVEFEPPPPDEPLRPSPGG